MAINDAQKHITLKILSISYCSLFTFKHFTHTLSDLIICLNCAEGDVIFHRIVNQIQFHKALINFLFLSEITSI